MEGLAVRDHGCVTGTVLMPDACRVRTGAAGWAGAAEVYGCSDWFWVVNLAGWHEKGLYWNRLWGHLLFKKRQKTKRLPSHACLSGPRCVSLKCSRYQIRFFPINQPISFPHPYKKAEALTPDKGHRVPLNTGTQAIDGCPIPGLTVHGEGQQKNILLNENNLSLLHQSDWCNGTISTEEITGH